LLEVGVFAAGFARGVGRQGGVGVEECDGGECGVEVGEDLVPGEVGEVVGRRCGRKE